MGKLTTTQIKSLKPGEKDKRFHDGNGLYLNMRTSGSKTFLYRDRSNGDTYVTLGVWPALSLAEARADVAQRKLAKKRKKSVAGPEPVSFKIVAERYYAHNRSNWSDTYTGQIRKILDRDVYPHIGDKMIVDVTSRDVLDLIRAIERRGAPSVAVVARGVICSVYRYAIVNLLAISDPTAAIRGAITTPRVQHSVALDRNQLKTLMIKIEAGRARRQTKIALHILARTFVRTGELLGARWGEFDFENKIWSIPASRIKNRIAHVVPLSNQVITLIGELPKGSSDDYVLPHTKQPGEHMHPTTCYSAVRDLELEFKFNPHGFRSTASTNLNTAGYRSDLIERQLAHVSGDKTRASYNHSDYLDERRDMMQWWSDEIDRLMIS